ncbi:c-type cytochrome [Hydrogenobacter thermophilus]|nr:c-type cytochrome [Hydrogenobacter thermophilus]
MKKSGYLTLTSVLGFALLAAGAGKELLSGENYQSEGKKIAVQGLSNTPACISCHGAKGEGMPQAGYPRLAGLPMNYMVAQLKAYKEGRRKSEIMAPIAQTLTESQMKAVAQYFASLKPVNTSSGKVEHENKELLEVGERLALYGNWDRGVPACYKCHGMQGEGVNANFPPIAGQPASYIQSQLEAFRKGDRYGGALNLMQVIAKRMTEEEIKAVSLWLASQKVPAPPKESTYQKDPYLEVQYDRPAKLSAADIGGKQQFHNPPHPWEIPDNEFGKMVKLGYLIFTDTPKYSEGASGNALSCTNCHIDAGRMSFSAPMWGAYPNYPAYRSKNNMVNTNQRRIYECFRFSMNGKGPAFDSKVMVALESYFYWLSKGLKIGEGSTPGRGYPKIEKPKNYDPVAEYSKGKQIYQSACAVCHGHNGEGKFANGESIFPPLWGSKSYNWGAGMHGVLTAAQFVWGNMPYALSYSLTPEEAIAVSTYINGHERPQDPRWEGSVEKTRKAYHDSPFDLYGMNIQGKVLGDTGAPKYPYKPAYNR